MPRKAEKPVRTGSYVLFFYADLPSRGIPLLPQNVRNPRTRARHRAAFSQKKRGWGRTPSACGQLRRLLHLHLPVPRPTKFANPPRRISPVHLLSSFSRSISPAYLLTSFPQPVSPACLLASSPRHICLAHLPCGSIYADPLDVGQALRFRVGYAVSPPGSLPSNAPSNANRPQSRKHHKHRRLLRQAHFRQHRAEFSAFEGGCFSLLSHEGYMWFGEAIRRLRTGFCRGRRRSRLLRAVLRGCRSPLYRPRS